MNKILKRIASDESGEIDDLPGWTILTLFSIVLISMIVLFGRAGVVQNSVQAAAYAAARDASLSRGSDAVPHAIAAAELALGDNANCRDLDVAVSGNGLTTGLGEAGTVSVTVTCVVSYGDLVFPGLSLPGSFTVTQTAHSPVDPYRER